MLKQTDSQLTSKDRQDLLKVIRARERVARSAVAERGAALMAEFERQIAARYAFDDDKVWSEAARRVAAEVGRAQAIVAERCAELGIPPEFAPRLDFNWYSRGENAARERRAELRLVARANIEALERAAIVALQKASLAAQEGIVAGGLGSEAARSALEALPSVEALMPPLAFDVVAQATRHRKAGWAERLAELRATAALGPGPEE